MKKLVQICDICKREAQVVPVIVHWPDNQDELVEVCEECLELRRICIDHISEAVTDNRSDRIVRLILQLGKTKLRANGGK